MRGTCTECGFDASSTSVSDSVVALRSFPRRWRGTFALAGDEPELLTRRPAPERWSPLEYAAHTRDVMAVNGWAMAQTLQEDHPVFQWPDGGADEVSAGYAALDPSTVLDELTANCERVASKAERTDAGEWRRPATLRGGRDEEVDALWFLHHCVHEGSHHLRDVKQTLGG